MTKHTASAWIPPYYDDLPGSLAEAWGLLVRGVVDRRSPLHTVVVATIDSAGEPSARTVVLRGVDTADWYLRFHTDQRSHKAAEIAAHPRVAVLAYHPSAKIQLRLRGVARPADAATADALWAGVSDSSRACYRVALAPGEPITEASDGDATAGDGRAHFWPMEIAVEQVEWLLLAAKGHRRARFIRHPDGRIDADWLVP